MLTVFSSLRDPELASKYGAAAAEAIEAVLPTLWTMGIQEIMNVQTMVSANEVLKAQQLILEKMNLQQLAQQKVLLTQISAQLISEDANTRQFWNNFMKTVLQAALNALIKVVL